MEKMLIIDSHSLAHRAFHALKDTNMRTQEGLPHQRGVRGSDDGPPFTGG